VTRTLALPEVAELRPILMPELPVYASTLLDEVEQATAGVADAVALGADGTLQVVIDWKSDVQPTLETVDHYRAQVRAYLDMTSAARGMIVMLTTGLIHPVTPSGVGIQANPTSGTSL
jgi:exodeoxyribonuclease-5